MRIGLIALVCLCLAACAGDTRSADPLATTTIAPVGFAPVSPSFSPVDEGDPLAGLRIEPEHSDVGYQRELFEHWTDDNHDGCDTRCEVLKAENGPTGWTSLYDGIRTTDPSDLEIDHVVALAEAWRSGADTWTPERRQAFANDLTHPDALIAVTIASNTTKSDSDPANWKPPLPSARCRWAQASRDIKVAWGLSADPAEAAALRTFLSAC